MIKNVVFDMGGVLMDFDPRHFVDQYKDELSQEDRDELKLAIYDGPGWVLLDWGKITNEEMEERAKSQLPERLHKYVYPLIYEWEKVLLSVPGTADIARKVKEKGYRLILLSNTGVRFSEYWPVVEGHELFEEENIYASAMHQMLKPHFSIYNDFFKLMNVEPCECIFIDDNAVNLASAELCGMQTILFRGAGRLEAELKKRNIL